MTQSSQETIFRRPEWFVSESKEVQRFVLSCLLANMTLDVVRERLIFHSGGASDWSDKKAGHRQKREEQIVLGATDPFQ